MLSPGIAATHILPDGPATRNPSAGPSAFFRLQPVCVCYSAAMTPERLTHTVAFRLTPSEYLRVLPFFESFDGGKGSDALRWLLSHEQVQALMRERVDSVQRQSP